jgi:serine/threonine protein kinase
LTSLLLALQLKGDVKSASATGKIKPRLERQQRLLTSLLRGLAYLHQNHSVHRDLSPKNVLVSASGEAVIADFEQSKDRELAVSVSMHSVVIAAARFALHLACSLDWLLTSVVWPADTLRRSASRLAGVACLRHVLVRPHLPRSADRPVP